MKTTNKTIRTLEGLYEATADDRIMNLTTKRKERVYLVSGIDSVSIVGKDGIRRHRKVCDLLALVEGLQSVPFDTGVETTTQPLTAQRFATNKELAEMQLRAIAPMLHRTDPDYMSTMLVILTSALKNRRTADIAS